VDNTFSQVALPLVLKYEGGYVNDPDDKGGATNKGITQKVYNSYRIKNNLEVQSVKFISNKEVEDIYFDSYWLAGKCDKLPKKVAIAHFDTCVNSGIGRGSKILQKAVGVVVDGAVGNQTLAAVNRMSEIILMNKYLDERVRFLNLIVEKNPVQVKFLRGWLNRVNSLRKCLTD
jgi:lysozyme family protein